MKTIILTRGKVAFIDDDDYPIVSLFKWYAEQNYYTFYAVTDISLFGKRITIRMHRLIKNAKPNEQIDHIDSNGLNNLKTNLRLCSHSQNNMNKNRIKNSSSLYKGVSWSNEKNKWATRICKDYNRLFIGYFTSEIEAAKVYDEKAKELFGEFARLNFQKPTQKIINNDQSVN